jgi:hypothetical protein
MTSNQQQRTTVAPSSGWRYIESLQIFRSWSDSGRLRQRRAALIRFAAVITVGSWMTVAAFAQAPNECEWSQTSFSFPATNAVPQNVCTCANGPTSCIAYYVSGADIAGFNYLPNDGSCAPSTECAVGIVQVLGAISPPSCTPLTGHYEAGAANLPITVTVAGDSDQPGCSSNGGGGGSGSMSSGLGPTGTSTNPQSCCGDPISTGTGNYYYHQTDLAIFDHIPDLPITFERSYNSLDAYAGPLGNNWTDNFNVFVSVTPAGAIVKWGDGHNEVYTLSGSVYIPGPGVSNQLAFNSSQSQYTLTRKDGVVFVFT